MILAWVGALAIGLALGLLGSGGSILTVPVLIYLIGQDEKTAIAGSLFIVGAIAAVGGAQFAARQSVSWRSVMLFGLPGMVGTYVGAWLGGQVSGLVQLAVFAIVMLLAAGLMFRPPVFDRTHSGRTQSGRTQSGRTQPGRTPLGRTQPDQARTAWKVALDGLAVGILTGFVGVGGGFLIVPALVLLGGLSMHLAIGTSLVIIALKSFTGFFKYVEILDQLGLALDWQVLLTVAGIGIAGSFVGRSIGSRVPQARLQRFFAVFLVVIGGLILWQTVPKIL